MRRRQAPLWPLMALTVAIALMAFILSFDALRTLAVACGVQPGLSWMFPLIIDAPVLASLKVLGLYAHAKITDQDPLTEPPVTLVIIEPGESWLERFKRLFRRRGAAPAPAASGPAPEQRSDPASPPAAVESEEQA